jgi:hypothetical protein
MDLTLDQVLDIASHVLHTTDKTLRSRDIADYALHRQNQKAWNDRGIFLKDVSVEDLARIIGSRLAQHVKALSLAQRVVTGTASRGWSLGRKASRHLSAAHVEFARPPSSQFTGQGGEYAVMSELLFCGWNVSKLAVDDGIDIFARKGSDVRTVQVKTSHGDARDATRFLFVLDRRAHDAHIRITHYYVLVMRSLRPAGWSTDFLILSAPDFQLYQRKGLIPATEKDSWSITIRLEDGRFLLADEEDVTARVNSFAQAFL